MAGEQEKYLRKYRTFSNLNRTLFTVSEGQKIKCGLESRAIRFAVVSCILEKCLELLYL